MILGANVTAGLFLFPHGLTVRAGQAGLIGLALLFAGGGVALWILVSLARTFPGETIGEYLPKVVGRLLSYPIILFYFLSILLWTAVVVRLYAALFEQLVLRETPLEVIQFALLLVSVYAAFRGIEAIGRFTFLVVAVVYLALVFLLAVVNMLQLDLRLVKPIMEDDYAALISGAHYTLYVIFGLQTALFFHPFCRRGGPSGKAAAIGYGLTAFIYAFHYVAVVGTLGVATTQVINWPGIAALQVVEIPGTFIERFGVVIIWAWSAGVAVTMVVHLWEAATLFTSLIKVDMGKGKYFIFPVALGAYWISIIPENTDQLTDVVFPLVSNVVIAANLAVPALLLLIARARGYRIPQRRRAGV